MSMNLTLPRRPPSRDYASHWSTPELAKSLYVAADSAPDLEGVRSQTIAGGDLQVDKVRDILALYMHPLAAVICVDEKTVVQALDRTQPLLPHTPQRRSHDYKCHGTIDLFAAVNFISSMVIGVLGKCDPHAEPP